MSKKLITSAAASKMIKTLQEDKMYLLEIEENASTYIKVVGYEDIKPTYNYEEVRAELVNIDRKIAHIKHALNLFNCTTKLPGFDITIDEGLVRMAQLNKEKTRLDVMRKRLPISRMKAVGFGESNSLVEYVCTNYDIEIVQKDYMEVSEQIKRIQLALDDVNQTIEFQLDL